MTRKQDSAKAVDWKEVIRGQEDFLRPLIREVLQQVLEAEMDERWVPRRGTECEPARLPSRLLRPDAHHAGWEAGIARAAGPAGPISNRGLRTLPAK
jgi:hypothetical protein